MHVNEDHKRVPTPERLRHWLLVTSLTLLGLLVAELPVFSHTRDRVYLWLQERLVRSHESVVVLAIDDHEFWRGEPGGARPLNRQYLARLLKTVADANPAAIGLDVGFETNTPDAPPRWDLLSHDEREFLITVNTVAQRCPVVLPRTISGQGYLSRRHDLFDAIRFGGDSDVTYGHTSSARDPRQIPTRVTVNHGELLDSFALAVLRKVMREVPMKLDAPHQPWPYSFFLPASTFVPKNAPVGRDGFLTATALRSASPAQVRRWLERQVVLIGGTWRVTPHGGDFADAHQTPAGTLPGVVVHANYVQSLLWDAMYAMPRAWRLSIEVLLALAVSVVFLLARGWRRLLLVLGTLALVVLLTWIFSAAIGVFFDMVVPVAFLGVHALWEGMSEKLRLDFRQKFRYAEHVFTGAALVAVVSTGFLFVRHEIHASEKQLATEDRLQVTDFAPPPLPGRGVPPKPTPAVLDPGIRQVIAHDGGKPSADPPKAKPGMEPQKVVLDPAPRLRQRSEFAGTLPMVDKQRLAEEQSVPDEPQLAAQQEAEEQPRTAEEESAKLRRIIEEAEQARRLVAEAESAKLRRIIEEMESSRPQQRTAEQRQSAWEATGGFERANEGQTRVRLVKVRKGAAGLFARSRGPSLAVAIDHTAQVSTPTDVIAFAEPKGKCAEQLTDALVATFSGSGSVVIRRLELKQLLATHGLPAADAITGNVAKRLGQIIGLGSLVSVNVHVCKTAVSAEGKILATIQITDLATGVTSAARAIQATVTPWTAGGVLSLTKRSVGIGEAFKRDADVDEIRERLVGDAAEQVQHLLFDWTETKTVPFFDDAGCSLHAAFQELQKGNIEGASREAQSSLDTCKSTPGTTATMLARAHYNRGMMYFLAGDYAAALTHLTEAKRLDSSEVFRDAVVVCERLHVEQGFTGRRETRRGTAAKAPSASREDRLQRLNDLHARGLITAEEYERKRKELLPPASDPP